MTDTVPEPAAPGFFERVKDEILPHAEHAGADVARIVIAAGGDIQDHAGAVYDLSADVLALVKMIDPADAALAAAGAALIPKVLAVEGKVTALAQGALKSG